VFLLINLYLSITREVAPHVLLKGKDGSTRTPLKAGDNLTCYGKVKIDQHEHLYLSITREVALAILTVFLLINFYLSITREVATWLSGVLVDQSLPFYNTWINKNTAKNPGAISRVYRKEKIDQQEHR
jgi:hypothetical protein